MKRRPKVWLTEDQILASIDRTCRMANRKLRKSQELAEVAKEKFGRCEALRFELLSSANLTQYQRESLESKIRSAEMAAGKEKDKADSYAAAYHTAINSTLPRLGEILSGFRTQTLMPVLGEYRGIAVK